MSGAGIDLSVVDLDKPASKLSGALWRRGGERKECLQLQVLLWNLNICIENVDVKC